MFPLKPIYYSVMLVMIFVSFTFVSLENYLENEMDYDDNDDIDDIDDIDTYDMPKKSINLTNFLRKNKKSMGIVAASLIVLGGIGYYIKKRYVTPVPSVEEYFRPRPPPNENIYMDENVDKLIDEHETPLLFWISSGLLILIVLGIGSYIIFGRNNDNNEPQIEDDYEETNVTNRTKRTSGRDKKSRHKRGSGGRGSKKRKKNRS